MNGVSEALRARIAASRSASIAAGVRWREGAEARAFAAVFAGCAPEAVDEVADRAEALLGDIGWAEALIAPLTAALTADPLYEPPLRVVRDGVRTSAVLLDCPAASLAASVTDAAAMSALPPPETLVFGGRVAGARYVRAGGATLARWRIDPDAVCRALTPLALADGAVVRCDGRVEAQLPQGARSDVVTLTIATRAGAPLVRVHRIADGALMRLGSADDGASRAEMLLAWLRHAGRADAGDCFEAASRDDAFHLRWSAMREWLALDASAALPRLGEMAEADSDAGVRGAAARMRPIVEARIAAACPA